MVSLRFDCVHVSPARYAAAPTLIFRLGITEATGARVHAIALRCQFRIEPPRRRYSDIEAERLHDLFGAVTRWSDTLKPIQFTTVSTMVSGFTGSTEVDLPVPCTYDLEVAAARYFQALDDGTVPLLLLFSGTVFLPGEQLERPGLMIEPVPWSAECACRLPVAVWREMIDHYFPHSGWVRLSRDTLDELGRFKSRHAVPTWDATISALLTAYPAGSDPGLRDPEAVAPR